MRISDWSSDVCSSDLNKRDIGDVGQEFGGAVDTGAGDRRLRQDRHGDRYVDQVFVPLGRGDKNVLDPGYARSRLLCRRRGAPLRKVLREGGHVQNPRDGGGRWEDGRVGREGGSTVG